MSFYCHKRKNPTCMEQCIDCEVWAALIDEKCDPTMEQKDKTIEVILRAYEQKKKELDELKKSFDQLYNSNML